MHRPSTVVLRSPMLCLCSRLGCTVIVFGGGTCVEHDPLEIAADQLLAEAVTRGAELEPDAEDAAGANRRRVGSPTAR